VDLWHRRYIEALQALYDAHKDAYDRGRIRDLRILG